MCVKAVKSIWKVIEKLMQDARKFMFTSDYPTPILVWKYETTLTVPVGQYFNAASKSVAHGLPFTPWLIGQWSTNANFVPAYDLANDMPIFTGTRPDLSALVGADSTYLRFTAEHTDTSAKTFYFRLFAFLPPDYTGDWNNPLSDTTHFTLDTEFNYPKMVKNGTITVPDGQVSTVAHNLGYIPQVRAWRQITTSPFDDYQTTWNILVPVANNQTPNGLLGVSSNITNVKFGNQGQSGVSMTYKYIIFGDEV